MRKLIIIIAVLVATTASAHAQTPESFISELIAVFNEGDAQKHIAKFSVPHVRVLDGVLTVQNDDSPFVDFERLRESGWATSRINGMEVIGQSSNSAIVALDFSRIDESGIAYLRTMAVYTISKSEESWQVVSVIATGSLPLGED
ncbi:MAG: hypothetical protein NXH85_07700 [Pseudomonadaceae bacterium]|nr:hypothetical protein [Pseudomonadaceae bacterium]